ncbi:hypothetical protein Glove_410g16 [Diversispora epigaea]|uniref:Uncharacterized protein n=1 Tax=Diversispora epigaea TaxID=1348612 RepID=A0A397GYY7_9GLOM|nr:hypothetical protein Glove_410g16 [Diversispora epigaea]
MNLITTLMEPTVIEILEKVHTSCNIFVNNYQETFNLPTKSKTKRKNELKGELNLVLEDINNIHKFCKDENSLKATQEVYVGPVKIAIIKILKLNAVTNSVHATKISATTTNSTRTYCAAINSIHTSTNKDRTDTNSRNSLTIPATSSSICSINSATRGVCNDLNNNNKNNNNINITSLGKRKNSSSSGGGKKQKTN